eukprot:1193637-Prorocentrum_minimum.AAC.2
MGASRFESDQVWVREPSATLTIVSGVHPQEMSEFLSGLNEWQEEVKVKDSALKKGKISEKSIPAPASLPPVRGKVTNTVTAPKPPRPKSDAAPKKMSDKKKKRLEEEERRKKEATAAGHTYDYFKDKWDKFDIDAALQEVDEESSEDEAPKAKGNGWTFLSRCSRITCHFEKTGPYLYNVSPLVGMTSSSRVRCRSEELRPAVPLELGSAKPSSAPRGPGDIAAGQTFEQPAPAEPVEDPEEVKNLSEHTAVRNPRWFMKDSTNQTQSATSCSGMQGNELYKKGDYGGAVTQYTKSVNIKVREVN